MPVYYDVNKVPAIVRNNGAKSITAYKQKVEYLGKTYGRLTIDRLELRFRPDTTFIDYYAHCTCACGKNTVSFLRVLINRKDGMSCGCIRASTKGRAFTTGNWTADDDSYKREYARVWGLNDRCYNPRNRAYPRYGGRGIEVCRRWRTSIHGKAKAIANFIEDMGYPPTRLHSIERVNVDKGYTKANCIWATEREQANNRSSNVFYRYYGREYTRTELAREMADEFDYDFNTIRAKLAATQHSPAWIVRWIRRRKLAALPS